MYRETIQAAMSAWPYVDGMVLHERRYEGNEVGSIAAIDLVLRYAPLLLDAKPLDELEQLLASYKRVLKDAYAALAEKLARARAKIVENHRLWTYLERNPGVEQEDLRQALGGEQERWRSVAESWARMGLLERSRAGRTYRLTLSTRMGEIVRGKCPGCGHVDEAPKAMFLDRSRAPGAATAIPLSCWLMSRRKHSSEVCTCPTSSCCSSASPRAPAAYTST